MILEDVLTPDGVAIEICSFKADDSADQFFAPNHRRIEFRILQHLVKSSLQSPVFLLVCRGNAGQILQGILVIFQVIAVEHDIAGCSDFCNLIRHSFMNSKILLGDLREINAVNHSKGSLFAPDQIQICFGDLVHFLVHHHVEFFL